MMRRPRNDRRDYSCQHGPTEGCGDRGCAAKSVIGELEAEVERLRALAGQILDRWGHLITGEFNDDPSDWPEWQRFKKALASAGAGEGPRTTPRANGHVPTPQDGKEPPKAQADVSCPGCGGPVGIRMMVDSAAGLGDQHLWCERSDDWAVRCWLRATAPAVPPLTECTHEGLQHGESLDDTGTLGRVSDRGQCGCSCPACGPAPFPPANNTGNAPNLGMGHVSGDPARCPGCDQAYEENHCGCLWWCRQSCHPRPASPLPANATGTEMGVALPRDDRSIYGLTMCPECGSAPIVPQMELTAKYGGGWVWLDAYGHEWPAPPPPKSHAHGEHADDDPCDCSG